jgi:hypothetical protein
VYNIPERLRTIYLKFNQCSLQQQRQQRKPILYIISVATLATLLFIMTLTQQAFAATNLNSSKSIYIVPHKMFSPMKVVPWNKQVLIPVIVPPMATRKPQETKPSRLLSNQLSQSVLNVAALMLLAAQVKDEPDTI